MTDQSEGNPFTEPRHEAERQVQEWEDENLPNDITFLDVFGRPPTAGDDRYLKIALKMAGAESIRRYISLGLSAQEVVDNYKWQEKLRLERLADRTLADELYNASSDLSAGRITEAEPDPEPRLSVELLTAELSLDGWDILRSRVRNIGEVDVSNLEITASGRVTAERGDGPFSLEQLLAGRSVDASFNVRATEPGDHVPVHLEFAYDSPTRHHHDSMTCTIRVVDRRQKMSNEFNFYGPVTGGQQHFGAGGSHSFTADSRLADQVEALLEAIAAHQLQQGAELPVSEEAQQLRAAIVTAEPDRSKIRLLVQSILAVAPGIAAIADAASRILRLLGTG
jgi:hypothetical protein